MKKILEISAKAFVLVWIGIAIILIVTGVDWLVALGAIMLLVLLFVLKGGVKKTLQEWTAEQNAIDEWEQTQKNQQREG